MVNVSRVEIIDVSKFRPRTVKKNSSTLGPSARIKPKNVRCPCTALNTKPRM